MLHELNGVFVVHLVQEELVQLEQLVALDVLDLLRAAHMGHLGDRVGEFQIDEGVHAVENALGVDVLLLVDGLDVFGSGCFC